MGMDYLRHLCHDMKLQGCKDMHTHSNHRSITCGDSFPCCSTNPRLMREQGSLNLSIYDRKTQISKVNQLVLIFLLLTWGFAANMPKESSSFLLPHKFPSPVVPNPRGWYAAAAVIKEWWSQKECCVSKTSFRSGRSGNNQKWFGCSNEQTSLCTPNPLSHTTFPFTIFTKIFTGDDSSPLTTTTNITSIAIVTGTHHLASILAMPGIEELVWVVGFFLVVLVKWGWWLASVNRISLLAVYASSTASREILDMLECYGAND